MIKVVQKVIEKGKTKERRDQVAEMMKQKKEGQKEG